LKAPVFPGCHLVPDRYFHRDDGIEYCQSLPETFVPVTAFRRALVGPGLASC